MFYYHTNGVRYQCVRSTFRPRARAWQATDTRSGESFYAATKDALLMVCQYQSTQPRRVTIRSRS